MAATKSEHILEYTRVEGPRRIDEERGVLYDLAVLGPDSANGRHWPESTMRAMLPMMEGRQSFSDHVKSGEPSVHNVLGVWKRLRVHEGRTRGDFHYFKSHPLSARLVEAARRPELNNALGFSINARGNTAHRNGRTVVESVDQVVSIDCVAQPATLAGLYESRAPMKTLRELIEATRAGRPRYSRLLREVAEAGILPPDAAMPEPPPAGPEAAAPAAADHEQLLLDACKAVLDSGLPPEEMVEKIKQILHVVHGAKPDAGTPPPPPMIGDDAGADDVDDVDDDYSDDDGGDDVDDKEKKESRKRLAELTAKLALLEARERLRAAADAARVSLPAKLLEHVNPAISEADARALVAELKGAAPAAQRPRSAGPVVSAVGTNGNGIQESKSEPPADPKAFAAWVTGR